MELFTAAEISWCCFSLLHNALLLDVSNSGEAFSWQRGRGRREWDDLKLLEAWFSGSEDITAEAREKSKNELSEELLLLLSRRLEEKLCWVWSAWKEVLLLVDLREHWEKTGECSETLERGGCWIVYVSLLPWAFVSCLIIEAKFQIRCSIGLNHFKFLLI